MSLSSAEAESRADLSLAQKSRVLHVLEEYLAQSVLQRYKRKGERRCRDSRAARLRCW
jgi:hypothetical protein